MSKVYVFNDYGGPEHEELMGREVPEPAAGELLLEVRAAGVNPVDWKIREGHLGRRWQLPAPMGREVAGVVAAVGEGVEDFTLGDAVLGPVAPGHGGFAEHTIVRAKDVVAKPEDVSFVDAATLAVAGTTAYDLTHQVELEEGQTLLVLGAGGGVGHMATQIGGVHKFRVIGVAGEDKREQVESTGATFVPSGDGVAARVRAVVPEGVDLLVDLVGGEPLRELASLAKDPTRVVSAADSSVTELGGATRQADAEALEKITGVVEYELVDPHVTATFPLSQVREALAAVENGHATGKVVIEM